jgi:DNA-directed RNA polymerase specialized sigma24 family protein
VVADRRLDIGALYARHRDELLAFFVRRTSDTEVALDLWGETFAQALAGRGRYRGRSEEEAGAWLFGIARRQLARYYRRGSAERRAMTRLGIERPAIHDRDAPRHRISATPGGLRPAAPGGRNTARRRLATAPAVTAPAVTDVLTSWHKPRPRSPPLGTSCISSPPHTWNCGAAPGPKSSVLKPKSIRPGPLNGGLPHSQRAGESPLLSRS